MGNNSKSGGGGAPIDYTEQNNQTLNEWKNNHHTSGAIDYAVRQLTDWVNTHNLRIDEISLDNNMGNDSRITFTDPETGKQITLSDEALQTIFTYYSTQELTTLLDEIRQITPTYSGYQLTESINIIRADYDGMFDWLNPTDIYIGTNQFKKTEMNDGPSLRGTLYHEMAHLYDLQAHVYSEDNSFEQPRPYQPTEYEDTLPSEVISTVMEQVATRTLRSDAQLPNGEHTTNYETWYEAWYPLTNKCENIISGEITPDNAYMYMDI